MYSISIWHPFSFINPFALSSTGYGRVLVANIFQPTDFVYWWPTESLTDFAPSVVGSCSQISLFSSNRVLELNGGRWNGGGWQVLLSNIFSANRFFGPIGDGCYYPANRFLDRSGAATEHFFSQPIFGTHGAGVAIQQFFSTHGYPPIHKKLRYPRFKPHTYTPTDNPKNLGHQPIGKWLTIPWASAESTGPVYNSTLCHFVFRSYTDMVG